MDVVLCALVICPRCMSESKLMMLQSAELCGGGHSVLVCAAVGQQLFNFSAAEQSRCSCNLRSDGIWSPLFQVAMRVTAEVCFQIDRIAGAMCTCDAGLFRLRKCLLAMRP